uniref:Uncharacterized protein n=1 Tax=Arundo donax TaxID=35708 RepID=A0A0A9GZ92_ARUDO
MLESEVSTSLLVFVCWALVVILKSLC